MKFQVSEIIFWEYFLTFRFFRKIFIGCLNLTFFNLKISVSQVVIRTILRYNSSGTSISKMVTEMDKINYFSEPEIIGMIRLIVYVIFSWYSPKFLRFTWTPPKVFSSKYPPSHFVPSSLEIIGSGNLKFGSLQITGNAVIRFRSSLTFCFKLLQITFC